MEDILISELPLFTEETSGVYILINNSGETETFKVLRELLLGGGNINPSEDNVYTLGNESFRWKSISIGEGTIFITDAVTGDEARLTIADGVFFIDGIAQAQLPNVTVTNLTFSGDGSVQTTAYIPPTDTPYTVSGGTIGGTQPTFSGAPMFDGSYVLNGDLVYFRVNVDMTNITNFGTGQYFITLPFISKYDTLISSGHLHDNSPGNDYVLFGEVEAGSNVAALYYQPNNSQLEPFDYNSPKTLQPVDFFHISGTYVKG